MATFLLPSVETCGGGQGISSKEEEACSSTPKKERVMTMANFLHSSVERREDGRGLCNHFLEKRGSALLVLGRKG